MDIILILLAIGALFIAAKIISNILGQYKCVDDDLLLDFYKGKLSKKEDLRRKVITHLGVCEKCQQKMINLKDEKPDLEKHLVDS